MRQPKFILRVSLVFATLAALAVLAGAALAGDITLGPVVTVSGPSPFANCTAGGPGTNYTNAEVEPWIAVNPANPDNIIAVWQQDRWADGGARGLLAASSHDGGRTWRSSWAHFSTCAGGTPANGGDFDRATDPWVTFSPNGHAYQISLSLDANSNDNGILVSKSTDGGDTWSEPVTLIREDHPFNFNDKESITADPTDSRYVYAVWDRSRFPSDNANFNALHSLAFRGDIIFTRTTDGGVTWETPRDVLDRNRNEFSIGNQIVVLPDGKLVDIFNLGKGSGIQPSGQYIQAVIRSSDHGTTWSRPVEIAKDRSVVVVDPDTGEELRTGTGLPDIAVDRNNGTLYAVWEDARFSGGAYNAVALSMSVDGGLTWSAPVQVNRTPNATAAFVPSVEVAADGTVGVTYYDFRSNTPAPGALADYWLAHCHSACSNPNNWSETHVAGPFDIETAPVARGYFLGDYQGLTSTGNGFLPLFVMTNSGDLSNRTDVFFTR